ncbi:unconventional myosin-VIIb [Labeo rohita]|uniref:Unconventional myosin-VIIb n=1 Tax=Labeo rohita TaxID=84645 RepID=A0A498MEH5_LABRO|nr:unconventional myosin-VIIb [Labeo rohita]
MVVLRKGDYVWVDCSDGVQIGAEVRLSDTGQLQLIDDEGKEHKIKKDNSLKPMHPTSVNGVDDMIRLGDLNEAGLLRNLLVRYKEGTIYTYTGSILVAVNPYQLLPIYTPEQVEQYTDRRLGDLPPHVFAIADSCFFNMRRNRKDQCCIISGESGAGKTESTKLMLQFLAAASHERNYHIFYCMLMGMSSDQKKILSLGSAAEYSYLTMGQCTTCEGRDDIKEYASFRSAMKILTFTENDTWEINKLLAAILHLGNVDFEETIRNNLEGCDVLTSTHFKMAAQLLEVAPNSLDVSLTQRSLMTNRESVSKPLTSAQAVDGRDAFVKAIYGKLFVWIVEKINSAIYKPPSDDPKHVRLSIGLLDIFGFENFTNNSQFRQSLDSLMKTLTSCQPFFIRCIKPNDFKKPMLFDRELCIRQLRYSGMMETIRIRKAGYPIRHTFDEFLERYRVLLKSSVCDPKIESAQKCCQSICENVLTEEDWKMGKTKVFLKDFHDTILELARDKALNEKALIIQRVLRGYKLRKAFLRKRRAAVTIQKTWRGHKVRKLYRVVQLGFARLQAQVRSRQMAWDYKQKRRAAVLLQAQIRGYLARKAWKRKRAAVILLQAYTRGTLARIAVRKMKRDAVLSLQERQAAERAALERQKRLDEILRQQKEREAAEQLSNITDQEMVDDIFGFLPSMVGGQEGQAPVGFEDLEGKRAVLEEVDLDDAPMMAIPEEDYDDLDEYSFNKFASMNFQGAATPTYIRQRLRQPLLYHEDENDVLGSLTVWWMILRFMGDLPEPKPQVVSRSVPAFADHSLQKEVASRQDRRLSHMVGLDQAEDGSEVSKQPTVQTISEEDEMNADGLTLDRPMNSLEKLHIIVGYAIVRRDLRDEIYCQICKQLQENSNRGSFFRGWILLSICLGIFPPTQSFFKYLQSFLRSGPAGYAPYCADRLRRTVANGVRGEPPSWLELQATKSKKPIVISVTMMDGRTISMPVDSATTSKEVCQMLSQKVKLQDTFGFSLYIALYDKVWSLGSGREHVMDAISQCEQEVKRKGGQEQHSPWRLYFRKEIFAPWHDCSQDNVSTEIIYRQVIRGLKYGEYQCEKEDDTVALAAKHFFVQFGSDMSMENTRTVVKECINSKLLEAKSEEKWVQMVNTAHAQGPLINSRTKPDKVKAEVVDYARQKWPMFFSKFFEVAKLSGPPLPKSRFIFAINSTGITFLDEREKTLLVLSYPELTGVNTVRDRKCVCLLTLKGDFTLNAIMASDISDLVAMFLAGLIQRSQYAVTVQEVNRQDDRTFLSFKKAELIYIIKDDEYSVARGWLKGKNERTGDIGAVPVDAILILPTLMKPTNEVLSLISLSPDQRKTIIDNSVKGTMTERVALWTLKDFSVEYFRQPIRDVNRQVISKNVAPEKLWANSREPIRQPLLKRLYMGDYPTRQIQSPLELTDQIFGPPTENEELRDEIYCQIMKQMTSNNNRYSVEQGWQLLWLCCGLFPPSNSLFKHAQRFIETRKREPLATDCLKRLQGARRMESRKLPPHQVEVEAIQHNSTQIFHKMYFPNDTQENFEVGSNTKVKDLVLTIADKLMLSTADGFSLFVKTPDKELPKYLRGYHVCSKQDMVALGALLFRVKVDNDKTQFTQIPRMLKELVPNDQLKVMSTDEWKKQILAEYNKQAGTSVEQAMIGFLKIVYKWPTFGCAFFDVKQTSEPNFPDIVRIAISKQGISIIHPKTKDTLAVHPYNKIASWCSGSTYFHMTVGSLVRGNKILCETSLGYKIDDLLTSYVNMYLVEKRGQRRTHYD